MKNAIKIIAAVLVICAFTVSACATGFVPSVEQKEVPAAVEVEGSVPADAVVIAPAASEEASEAAAAAYAVLVELGSADAIDESLAGAVVTDVFEVTANEDVEAKLAAGESVNVSMAFEAEEGQTVTVLFFNGTEWVVVPAEFVTFENGVLTITMTEMGVYAIVVK